MIVKVSGTVDTWQAPARLVADDPDLRDALEQEAKRKTVTAAASGGLAVWLLITVTLVLADACGLSWFSHADQALSAVILPLLLASLKLEDRYDRRSTAAFTRWMKKTVEADPNAKVMT